MGRPSVPHPCAIFTLLKNSSVFANSVTNPFSNGSFRTISTNPSNCRDVIVKLCSSGSLKEACERFRSDIWSDPNLFTTLLQGCMPKKSLGEVRQLHSLIITSGASSDRFISNHLLNIYAKFGELKTAASLFETMPRKNVMSYNILIGGFIQNGDLKTAHQLFNEMPDRNVASWNAMLAGLIDFGFNEEGLQLFLGMREYGLQPDEFTLGSVLRGVAGIKGIVLGQQVHISVIKSGLQCDLCVGSSLAHMYMNCQCVDDGERVLEGMPVRNVVSFNTIIAGRAQNGFPEIALNHFHAMKVAGLEPDQVTFVSVIASCSELATLGQGQQVHAQTIKAGVNSEVAVQSSLVSMYSKCGCLNESVTIFLESGSLDLVLWSSTIAAYGFHGQGQEAIILFKRMVEEGIEPNDVTFLSLLYACTHSGLKKHGMEFFEIMTQKYRIEPRLEHYTCMVDLLGRSGCLEEAEKMINSMPVRPDAVIWKTMLSACKIHRKVEMAERVTGHVVRLDPQDSAPYVLLSNIRATDERWEDVSEVRASMRERKVRKEPGISWVELKNHVHQFCIGDRSHPKQREIDQYLNELVAEMKQHGYAPDTSTVLHDMEDEEKEYSLVHHSEKMAIAFAILNTPEGTLIRVMKNLRVCDDCHIAIKFISEIKMREIVVRDASRFHHFRDGECSCGDYW